MRLSLCFLILITFWAAIYVPALGSRELRLEEPRRVLPGRTMIQSGEWIVPRSGGEVYNRKPPLTNWVSAGAMLLTGRMDEWTVRTPAVLMILLFAVTMLVSLKGWLGNEQALATALATLTSIQFIDKGRIIEIEALYISLFGMALSIWLGLWWRNRHLAAWLLSGLVLGIGFLAKGPLHAWYFYALIIGVLSMEGRLRDLLNWRHFAGLAVFFATFLPWAMENSKRNPLKDSSAVWKEQITHRLGFSEFNLHHYLMQIPDSLIGFLPWALLLPLCWRKEVVDAWRNAGRHGQWMLGLRKGLPWAFLVIAILPSSRPRFMLPLNAAAAIIVTDALWRMSAEWFKKWGRVWRITTAVLSAIALIALLIGPFTTPASFNMVEWVCWLIAGWQVLSWQWRRSAPEKPITLVICVAGTLAIASAAYAYAAVPHLLPREKLRPFAAKIVAQTGTAAPIMLFKVEERLWPFYLGMRCYEVADIEETPKNIDFAWVIVPKRIWAVTNKRKTLCERVGKAISESALEDPIDQTPYVLVHFKKS